MSMFNLKGSANNNWNYADTSKENYSAYIQGLVVFIDNPQTINFVTKKPEFYDNGNPKRNFRVFVLQADGTEIVWQFSGYRKGAPVQAIVKAMDKYDENNNGNITYLLGKVITVHTPDGKYGMGNPRKWDVRIDGEGDGSLVRGSVDYDKEEQKRPEQQPQQQMPPAPASMQVGTNPPPANVVQQVQQAFGVQPQEVREEVPMSVYDNEIPF